MVKKIALLVVLVLALVVYADNAQAFHYSEIPMVVHLRQFTAECGYMSHAGFVRYLVYLRTGSIINLHEAKKIVAYQKDLAAQYKRRGR